MYTVIAFAIPAYILIRRIVYDLFCKKDKLLDFAHGGPLLDENMWKTGYFYKLVLWVDVETYAGFLVYLTILTIILAYNQHYVWSIFTMLTAVSAYWETWKHYKKYKQFSDEMDVILKEFLNKSEERLDKGGKCD